MSLNNIFVPGVSNQGKFFTFMVPVSLASRFDVLDISNEDYKMFDIMLDNPMSATNVKIEILAPHIYDANQDDVQIRPLPITTGVTLVLDFLID